MAVFLDDFAFSAAPLQSSGQREPTAKCAKDSQSLQSSQSES
jgi:hypothetical protein